MISDKYCTFNKESHRYVLTPAYVLEQMNVDLYDVLNTSGNVSDVSKMPQIVLDRVSRQIYGYVYANSAYTYERERVLALDESLRPFLMDAMAEQLTYILNNGDVSAYSGVNAMNGMTVDPSRMRLAEIAPIARDILEVRGIISRGIYPFPYHDEPSYERDGY